MIVSWNWLKQYVALDMSVDALAERLMMAGLNHESTDDVAGDLAIDLEVTSNRPDCLGHLGVAREASVLFDRPLTLPSAAPREGATPVAELTSVALECPELCHRYTARVVRGVKIAESPAWLRKRLETLGVARINNVADVTNYVMLECGQPLHAFDLHKLAGHRIIVREARPGEPFEAINHKSYTLQAGMCVIADAERPVALGGVMGGANSEVTANTVDVLIEAAEFSPSSVRDTARKLNLHSDSSYRFERGLDPEGVDWASRRACELILELSGGELAAGVIDVGRQPALREPVTLRFAQLTRILGIEVDSAEARRILTALGCAERASDALKVTTVPPSWRRDLTREIDLVEEVARVHGYEKIPEDVVVPMSRSSRRVVDRVSERVRQTLTACGFDEAMTLSVVDAELADTLSPWTDEAPLQTSMPVLRGADRLRRSLLPSLLAARHTNQSLDNHDAELFEVAKAYWPQAGGLPREEMLVSLVSGRDFLEVKGVIEAVVAGLGCRQEIEVIETRLPLLDRAAELRLADERLGFLGGLTKPGRERFELREAATVAELRLSVLEKAAQLVRRQEPLPPFPAIHRDINLQVDEAVRWAALAGTVRSAAGELLESLVYRETYRGQQVPSGKKRLLFSLALRSPSATLTSQQADEVRDRIVAACRAQLGAELSA